MRERPVVFGDEPRLVGVITEATSPVPGKTACIFVNAGLIHRVGPNRLYVRLARHLASLGYSSIRFDLAGRGDSDTRRDGLSFLEGSLADLKLAMDVLQEFVSAERFVLMGICSGAVNSLYAATLEPRVAGVIAIDGPAFQTFGYHLRRHARRITRFWSKAITGRNRIGRWTRGAEPVDPGGGAQARAEDEFAHLYGDLTMPSRDEAAQVLNAMADRGAQLLFIYTGSWSIYNYADQFRDAFPEVMKRGAVRVAYTPEADHTFTRLHHQQYLVDMVTAWFLATFGGGAPVERRGVAVER